MKPNKKVASRMKHPDIAGHPPINDNSIMRFGNKHYGKPMNQVPDEYKMYVLKALARSSWLPKSYDAELYKYLKNNEENIKRNLIEDKK